MQIFALDENETLVSAFEAKRKKDYFCQECKEVVHARGGNFRRDHFYHIKLSQNCRQSKKTLQHLTIQLYFESHLPLCALEVPFPKIKRIADCVWEEEKIIFEIQVSPISKEEVKRRNFDYKSLGYDVVWILHDKTFNQKRTTVAELYLQKFSHYYSNINLEGNGDIYDQVSHIKNRLFFKKSSPRVIDFTQVLRPPFKARGKRRSWQLGFGGDFTQDLHLPEMHISELKVGFMAHFKNMWNHILGRFCT